MHIIHYIEVLSTCPSTMLTYSPSSVSVGEERTTDEDLAATRIDVSAASAQLAADTMAATSREVASEDNAAAEDVLDTTGAKGFAVGAAVAAVEAPVDDQAVEAPMGDVMPDEQAVGVDGEDEGQAMEAEFEDYVNVQPMVDVASYETRAADKEIVADKPAHTDRSLAEAGPMVIEAVVETVNEAPVDAAKGEPSPDALASVVEGKVDSFGFVITYWSPRS